MNDLSALRVVSARFPNNARDYHYFIQPGDNPVKGDFIVTSFGDYSDEPFMSGGFKHAVVESVVPASHKHRATKPYLLLVPVAVLNERKKQAALFMEADARRRAARERLFAMLQEQQEDTMFAALAQNNPEAAKLLSVLRSPMGGLAIESEAKPNE